MRSSAVSGGEPGMGRRAPAQGDEPAALRPRRKGQPRQPRDGPPLC